MKAEELWKKDVCSNQQWLQLYQSKPRSFSLSCLAMQLCFINFCIFNFVPLLNICTCMYIGHYDVHAGGFTQGGKELLCIKQAR